MRHLPWGLVAVAALAAASPVVVQPNATLDTVHAERLEIDARLVVAAIELGPALTKSAASGTAASPVELSEAPTTAGTGADTGHWTYTVTLRERAPDSVPAGAFVVQLVSSGTALAEVHLQQAARNPALAEGARVTFDVGPAEPQPASYVLLVRSPSAGEIVLAAGMEGADPVWRDAAGARNASLEGAVGTPMRFRILYEQGIEDHNLRILRGNQRVAGPSGDIRTPGDQATLTWTPAAPGTYRYQCQYHTPTMTGFIQVSE